MLIRDNIATVILDLHYPISCAPWIPKDSRLGVIAYELYDIVGDILEDGGIWSEVSDKHVDSFTDRVESAVLSLGLSPVCLTYDQAVSLLEDALSYAKETVTRVTSFREWQVVLHEQEESSDPVWMKRWLTRLTVNRSTYYERI